MEASGSALVTGAARGIGRALALELAARGFDVVAAVRRPEAGGALTEAAVARGTRLRVALYDVTAPGDFAMPRDLRVLVNNAGLEGDRLPVETSPVTLWREVFETNVFGLVETTRRALPELRRSGGGVVCNLTSAALVFPMPFYAVYRASKAAVAALGESLRAEVAPHGIRVLEVMPGPVATDMLARADSGLAEAAPPAYRALAERVEASQQAAMASPTPVAAAAAAIADAILDDDAPHRVGCDPLGRELLAGWRETENEQWLDAMLAGLGLSRG